MSFMNTKYIRLLFYFIRKSNLNEISINNFIVNRINLIITCPQSSARPLGCLISFCRNQCSLINWQVSLKLPLFPESILAMNLVNVLLEIAISRECDGSVETESGDFVKILFLNSHLIA